MAQWRQVCALKDLRTLHKFIHRNKQIVLYKIEGEIYATDNICSHEFSELSQGMIVNGNIYCTKHGSRFEIKTGKVLDYPATRPIKTFETKIEDGIVFVKC